jgi:uncharacterized membrane protein YeiB
MTDASATHPAPHRHRVSFIALMFGMIAAPIFWLGQLMLGYGVSAVVCYGSDHPTTIMSATALRSALILFDAIAIIAAISGGIVSCMSWRAVRDEKEGGQRQALEIGDGRARFMALWGIMSSLWFFIAIIFSTIASVTVPLCIR